MSVGGREDENWCGERARRGQVWAEMAGTLGRQHRGRPEELEGGAGRQGGPASSGWTGKEVLAEGLSSLCRREDPTGHSRDSKDTAEMSSALLISAQQREHLRNTS